MIAPAHLHTKTQWRRQGRKVIAGAPRRGLFIISSRYSREYEFFSIDDTVPIAPRVKRSPVVLPLTDDSILSALRTINDAAKRRRDAASTAYRRRQHGRAQTSSYEKGEFYRLKDAVLERLLEEGRAFVVGHHAKTDRESLPKPRRRHSRSAAHFEYDDDDIDLAHDDDEVAGSITIATVLEVIEFAGHRFHRPVKKDLSAVRIDTHLGDGLSPARPLGSLRIVDAKTTLDAYLKQSRIFDAVVDNVTWRDNLCFPDSILRTSHERHGEYAYRHGPVQASLQRYLRAALPDSCRVVFHERIDLAVLQDAAVLFIFEVKTALGQQLYSGIGQLLIYRQLFSTDQARLFLVLPDEVVTAKELVHLGSILERLDISLVVERDGNFFARGGGPLRDVISVGLRGRAG